ncbi:MAG: cupin domain-containing protein [Gammaproteobacteria bacterium]|nr:MAG: cupin domain-containing protein [Gammaproteobacteria bacterium]
MIKLSHYASVAAYTTKDGSIIRELMHPLSQGNRNQSLAEATIPGHSITLPHKHLVSEEIYYIIQGAGSLSIGGEILAVNAGDSILIPPGTTHNIRNDHDEDLVILCCCSPAYSHDDTILV